MREPSLGEQELNILRVVAEDGPLTAAEVTERFAGSEKLARTTIHTVLERLRGKGYLQREKCEGIYRYSSSTEKTTLLTDLVGTFMQRTLRGSLKPFMSYLANAEEISDEELTELKELVRTLEGRRKCE